MISEVQLLVPSPLTETNIILAIPKPPTRIEKLPITHPAILIVAKIVEIKQLNIQVYLLQNYHPQLALIPSLYPDQTL